MRATDCFYALLESIAGPERLGKSSGGILISVMCRTVSPLASSEQRGMSDTGLIVPGMTEPPNRYDVTVTVVRDGGFLPDPVEFAVAVEKAASSRVATVVSAHTAAQIISVVTVLTADRSAAVALAVVSEALRRPVALPSR